MLALAIVPATAQATEPFPPEALPGTSLGGLLVDYEPSGLVWHPRLQRLFGVSDGSSRVSPRVFSLTDAGTELQFWTIPSSDLEGITVADPASDFLYVGTERIGTEQPNAIKEFNVSTGLVTRTFDLSPWMTGADTKGLEALTFVTDSANPEGGLFYAGLQDGGVVYRFALPILTSSTSTAVTFIDSFTPVPGRSDLSGLNYDVGSGLLYGIYDNNGVAGATSYLVAMETDGTLMQQWDLPGSHQEGIAMRPNDLFIAEDSGDVLLYTPSPVPEPGTLAAVALAVAAGVVWQRRRCR